MRHVLLLALASAVSGCSNAPAEAPATPVAEAPAPEAPAPEAEAEAEWSTFGGEFTMTEIIPAAALLKDPAPFTDKTVRVEGRVADVCQKAGCWMVIAEGDDTMRVRMKDHDFAVAKDGAGAICQIEGVITAKPMDPKEAEHFASESANTDVMPENKIKAGAMTYEIVASAVQFKK